MVTPQEKGVLQRTADRIAEAWVHLAQIHKMHPGIELVNREFGDPTRPCGDQPGWHCDTVQPVVWFGERLLTHARPALGPWKVTADHVRLQTVNGEWIWFLTDEYRSDLEDCIVRRKAVWPD